MDPETTELLAILDEMIALLEEDADQHWTPWLKSCRNDIGNLKLCGIERLLSVYGGMGSFSDLVICQSHHDGQFAWKPGYQEKNDRFDSLRGRAMDLADAIRRDHNRQ